MKLFPSLICAALFATGGVFAQSPATVTVTVNSTASGPTIPDDFVGLSFGMRALLADQAGVHFFSPTNRALTTLFQNLGIKHLRMGGTTVESPPSTPIPGRTEIDDLFAFARVAGVQKVIYSLRLLENDQALHYAETNAAIAKYVWGNYREQLDCFAIGNEPDLKRVFDQDLTIRGFSTYLSKWQRFAAAITNVVPDAKFAGPDAGSGNVNWTIRFAEAQKKSGMVKVITEHFYVGGAGRGVPASQGIDAMLSPDWLAANQTLHDRVAVPVSTNGLVFRFTEANDHYSGGVTDASDTFAGALWALDFLHWWAAHGTTGVDFHNTQWVVNDVISRSAGGQLKINPKGYGLKAFGLGSHGRPQELTISNPDKLNLTVYGVQGSTSQFVTIINKEHGAGARDAKITLVLPRALSRAEVIYLRAPGRDASDRDGVTLGQQPIRADQIWSERWLTQPFDKAGHCKLDVPAASAAVVKVLEK